MDLTKISKPLEDLIGNYGFVTDEIMMDTSIRMISFVHPEGKRVEYMIHVLKHKDKGEFSSNSEVNLSIRLYIDKQPIELFPLETYGSNMPMAKLIQMIQEEYIEPGLREHLKNE